MFLVALVEVTQSLRALARTLTQGPHRRGLATGLVFILIKTTPVGEGVYEAGLGLLQWPFATLDAALAGRALPDLQPVTSTRDITDLLALPALFVAYLIGRSRVRRPS